MESAISRFNPRRLFQYVLSTVIIIDGIDKFFNLITYWPLYIAPQILDILPISQAGFLYLLGVIEISIGCTLWLNKKWGGVLVALLLFGIAVNLVIAGKYYNIALIDLVLAVAALALTQDSYEGQEAQS